MRRVIFPSHFSLLSPLSTAFSGVRYKRHFALYACAQECATRTFLCTGIYGKDIGPVDRVVQRLFSCFDPLDVYLVNRDQEGLLLLALGTKNDASLPKRRCQDIGASGVAVYIVAAWLATG